jgi:two-component system, NtrC family, response regulator HydG
VNTKILIVEDQFIEANNLRDILKNTGYSVSPIASSVPEALEIISRERPDMVLLDIYLQGPLTGIDLGGILMKQNIAFVYLSANSEREILNQAKVTRPYGFLVKPFRKKDVLVTLDVAWYLHQQKMQPVATDAPESRKRSPVNPAAGKQIIGKSSAISNLLEKVSVVGPSDISVLILGENGTGKELIAQRIHQLSARSGRPLVTVNCAALPTNLIESELFGHEKGAFTGATEKRIGKFEQAHEGTIFLDEIGELLPNLQAKLLRTLQEKEIEPIGGRKRTIDVRVITATNRNLEEEIASGNFRMDLYYRLSVFPLTLPTLRDRKEDIPLLADHFLQLCAQKEKKTITGFADHVIKSMIGYDWPGNVRELENFVARSVIMTHGQVIDFTDLPSSQKRAMLTASPECPFAAPASKETIKSMSEHEKEYILSALISCNWKLYGQDGAANLLQMHPSTLNSRMKKLGIHKKSLSKLDRGKNETII